MLGQAQAHATDALACLIESTAMVGVAHDSMCCLLHQTVMLSISDILIRLLDLLLRGILRLIWQVIRVGVLWSNLLDRVTKFSCIYSEHTLINLIFQHESTIFFVNELVHPWCAKSLIPKRSILNTLSIFLQLDFLRTIFRSIRGCCCLFIFLQQKIQNVTPLSYNQSTRLLTSPGIPVAPPPLKGLLLKLDAAPSFASVYPIPPYPPVVCPPVCAITVSSAYY